MLILLPPPLLSRFIFPRGVDALRLSLLRPCASIPLVQKPVEETELVLEKGGMAQQHVYVNSQ